MLYPLGERRDSVCCCRRPRVRRAVAVTQDEDLGAQQVWRELEQPDGPQAVLLVVRQRWTPGIHQQDAVAHLESLEVRVAGHQHVDPLAL